MAAKRHDQEMMVLTAFYERFNRQQICSSPKKSFAAETRLLNRPISADWHPKGYGMKQVASALIIGATS